MSPSVLNERLAESDAGGYRLTPVGAEPVVAFGPLSAWSLRWQRSRRR